ncbi:glycosyltransferase family 2 protein [Mycoplasma elephantis]|uniref:glycosyltransferase family 2 protein n=1 Tax=Mycoplasma elephantis TaxID=114882 RepID=UPI00048367CF|nr:glycosyltransferase family 2 protein [Mycoplasma elephantis]
MDEKICTIIIPAYNMENYLIRTIESITKNKNWQKYLEVKIIDDGSTDSTFQISKKFSDKYDNIETIRKENGNWGSVINYAKNNKIVNTKYTLILDADDKISSNFLKYLLKWDKKINFDLAIFKTKIIYFRKLSIILNPKIFINGKNYSFFPSIIPCSTIFKTSLFYKIDDLIENVSYQDYILYYKMLKKTNKNFIIPKVGAIYWFSRPNNTMSSGWNDRRITGEKILFSELEKLNLEHLFMLRIILPKYIKGLSESNLIIKITREDYNKVLKNASWFFRKIFDYKLRKAIKRNCVQWSNTKTLFCSK